MNRATMQERLLFSLSYIYYLLFQLFQKNMLIQYLNKTVSTICYFNFDYIMNNYATNKLGMFWCYYIQLEELSIILYIYFVTMSPCILLIHIQIILLLMSCWIYVNHDLIENTRNTIT